MFEQVKNEGKGILPPKFRRAAKKMKFSETSPYFGSTTCPNSSTPEILLATASPPGKPQGIFDARWP